MNQIILALNVYNDYPALMKGLETVIPLIDGAVVIDGAYPEYPMIGDHSSDGTIQYIDKTFKEYGKKLWWVQFPERKTEIDKRTTYFEFADTHFDWPNTWLIVWDGDYELEPDRGKTMKDVEADFTFLRNTNEYKMVYLYADYVTPYEAEHNRNRAYFGFHDCPGLMYKYNHFNIYEKVIEREVKAVYPSFTLMNTRIMHNHLTKTQERIDARSYYSSNLSRKYEV